MSLASSIETACQFAALMLVQSTLLIAGVYLALKLFRLSEAALLSVIYRNALLATLVAPLGTFVMMRSEIVGWWPREWSQSSVVSTQPMRKPVLVVDTPISTLSSKTRVFPNTQDATMEPVPKPVLPKVVRTGEAGSGRVPPLDIEFIVKSALCSAWGCISILLLIRLWRTHRQLWRTLSKAVPVEPSIQSLCNRLAAELQVSPPRVVCSPYFSSPFLAGVLHPIVHLSNESMDSLDNDQTNGLRDILIHELAHLKRRDVLIRMLNHFILSIFFFQPLLWYLAKWLENSAEDVCDDYAMRFGARRDHYAGRLVDLVERCDFPVGLTVGVASGKSMLVHRVTRIMDGSRKLSTGVSRLMLAFCGLVTTAAVIAVCLFLTPERNADAFEKLTAIENAVHTEQRDGLIFTIHQAKRFQNGGVLIMSSVRGTNETLGQFPLKHGMRPDGPATNWHASPQGSEYFRLMLAEANHQGVDVQWWIMVPRRRDPSPNWFEEKDGKVPLDIGITPQGEYAKAKHKDERGVIHSIYWRLPLDIPKQEQLPSLDDIVTNVHSELSELHILNFAKKLDLGVKDVGSVPTRQFGSPYDVSPEAFAKATREHWEYWERIDVDFQIKSGGTSYGNEIGSSGMKPALMVDYNSAVDDSTLARANERTGLVMISARGTKITDSGLAHLSQLPKLKALNVASTSITDDGLQHLQKITSLENLNVTDTGVTQAGIERLRKFLPKVVVVTQDNDTVKTPPKTASTSGSVPQPLPSKVTGIVIDTADKPVSNAQVTVLIRTFSKDMHEEMKGPHVFTAMTDENGRYSLAPTGTVHANNEVRIKVVAEGFADVSDRDYEKKILTGVLPTVRMLPGRRIKGRLVNEDGARVNEAIVRFQCGNADLTVAWDSGPFPVDSEGRFSLSIPTDGTAVSAIYPNGFAPRFIDVTSEDDQGDIVLNKGVALKGRVVDRNGRGVAKTIVGILKTEHRVMHAYMAVIGTAVRTDDSGYFQLPALSGNYKLTVERSVADYSRQMMLDGEAPPSIKPVTIEFNSSTAAEDILLKEQAP